MRKEVNEPESWSSDTDSDKRCPRKHKYDPLKCNPYCPWLIVCIKRKYCKPINDAKMEALKTERDVLKTENESLKTENKALKNERDVLKTDNDTMHKFIEEQPKQQSTHKRDISEKILGTVQNIQREMFILNEEFRKFNEQPKPQQQVITMVEVKNKEEPLKSNIYTCGVGGCKWNSDIEKDVIRHREAEHGISR